MDKTFDLFRGVNGKDSFDHTPAGGPAIDEFQVLVTAEEAYPALEREFLTAKSEISASFRIFDLTTPLYSAEARDIGKTWMELFVHTLERGVEIRLIVSDFDPVAAPELHQLAWHTQRQIAAVRELARKDCRLEFAPTLHRARVGKVPRLLFYPLIRKKLKDLARMWRDMSNPERERFKSETPRLRDICDDRGNGSLRFYKQIVDLYPATHHQKLAVFDRKRLYIGGLDVNERRFDTKSHSVPADRTWHDIQVLVTGSVARSAHIHLGTFLDSVASKKEPVTVDKAFIRTLSRPRRFGLFRVSPATVVAEIEERHMAEIARSSQLVYLETQFFRHLPLAKALGKRAGQSPELCLMLVLPAAPEDVAFENSQGLDAKYGEHLQVRCLSVLKRAFGPDRLLIVSPVQPQPKQSDQRDTLQGAPLIYVHSKVSIFDDFGGIVSSANLNGRSFRWDTEAGVHLTDASQVMTLRRRVMTHWLPKDASTQFVEIGSAFEKWKRLVDSNTALPPQKRNGFLVHHDSEAARELAQPLPGIPPEIV